MGKVIEKPISQVVAGGAKAINDYISNGGLLNIFVWMGLIYLITNATTEKGTLDLSTGLSWCAR
jgi:hypothetical protein